MYETSYNAAIVNNTFVRNALVKGPTNPHSRPRRSTSPSRAATQGRRARTTRHSACLETCSPTTGRASWRWENADRFAGSPLNTSTG